MTEEVAKEAMLLLLWGWLTTTAKEVAAPPTEVESTAVESAAEAAAAAAASVAEEGIGAEGVVGRAALATGGNTEEEEYV